MYEEDKEKKKNLVFGIIGGIVLLLLIFSFSWIFNKNNEITENKSQISDNFCKKNQNYVSAILIDDTDELSTNMKNDIVRFIEDYALETPRYSKLVFYRVSDYNKKVIRPITICNPVGKDKANALIENEKKFEYHSKLFSKRISHIINKALKFEEKKYSPIIEMVHYVVTDAFKSNDDESHLILVSDLMQNTPEFSLFKYKNGQDFSDYQKTFHWKKNKKNMSNVFVHLKQIPSNLSNKVPNLDSFWEDYFRKQHAKIKRDLDSEI